MSASSGSPHLYRSAKRVSPSETLSPLHRNDSALAIVGTVAIMTAQQACSNALTTYWRARPVTIRFGWTRTTEGSDGVTKASVGMIATDETQHPRADMLRKPVPDTVLLLKRPTPMKPATLIREERFPQMAMAHQMAMPSLACSRREFLRTERIRSVRLVPRRKRPTRPGAPLNAPRVVRSKFLSLTGLAISFALAVMAAGSLLDDPRSAPTSAIASMEPHALSTILLRVP